MGPHFQNLEVTRMRTIDAELATWLTGERLLAVLSVAFGVTALFLICVGLHGVVSQWAARPTQEIGVRSKATPTQCQRESRGVRAPTGRLVSQPSPAHRPDRGGSGNSLLLSGESFQGVTSATTCYCAIVGCPCR
jgi:hypothetical protein